MSEEVGNISFYDSSGRSELTLSKPYSEKTAELIDSEVKKIIDKAHKMAMSVLKENRVGFETLAKMLLEREVIFSEDLERIFGPRKGRNPNNIIEEAIK